MPDVALGVKVSEEFKKEIAEIVNKEGEVVRILYRNL
jgi:hypothetical protein